MERTAPWPKVANASNSLSAALLTTWLKLVEEGMMCLLCEKYNKNKLAPSGKQIWSVEPRTLFRLQSVHWHANSNMHNDVVRQELDRQCSESDVGVPKAF